MGVLYCVHVPAHMCASVCVRVRVRVRVRELSACTSECMGVRARTCVLYRTLLLAIFPCLWLFIVHTCCQNLIV